jgi:predicted metal-dependent HD superfamily phosphohydrolase
MNMQMVQRLSDKVLSELETLLSEKLTYHGVHHTIDVMQQSLAIAKREGISAKEEFMLLQVSALYHDTGFLTTYRDHETESCKKAMKELPLFDFSAHQVKQICSLIQATRIPQQPTNLLEQILADADLDYLGRNDFQKISSTLQREFISYGIVNSPLAFEELQLRFFESHEYFTKSSQQLRGPVKKLHYEELKKSDLLRR